jgi:hypothetical protein
MSRATDAGFFRLTFIIGMIIQLVGIFMTSLCITYWQVFLAQGICISLGNGLVFIPSITICSTYFLKNRALALGVAAALYIQRLRNLSFRKLDLGGR